MIYTSSVGYYYIMKRSLYRGRYNHEATANMLDSRAAVLAIGFGLQKGANVQHILFRSIFIFQPSES